MTTNGTAARGRSRRGERLRERYGPWAVVTGASDGIGRDMALRLAESGVGLVLVARRRERLEAVVAALAADHGIQTRVIVADLGTGEGVRAVEEGTADLDVGLLVAAAGFGTAGPFLRSDLARELDLLAVNCRAVVALAHHFGRRFAARGRGGMVLMGSVVGFQGVPHAAHYAATKAYVQSLAEGLHAELAPLGVDVLSAAPGPVHSGFAARAGMRMGAALRPEQVGRATLDALGRRATVVPGLLSKVLTYSLATLPRSLRVRVMSLVMGGMTRHLHGTA